MKREVDAAGERQPMLPGGAGASPPRDGGGDKTVTEERLRIRVGNEQVHYMGGLAAGAFVLQLFGDVAGCLSIRRDGTGGLLAGYDQVDILYPIHVGDLVEVVARLEKVGNTSRKISYEAHLILSRFDERGEQGRWREFDPPILAARALGTSVVRREDQHGGPMRIDGSRWKKGAT